MLSEKLIQKSNKDLTQGFICPEYACHFKKRLARCHSCHIPLKSLEEVFQSPIVGIYGENAQDLKIIDLIKAPFTKLIIYYYRSRSYLTSPIAPKPIVSKLIQYYAIKGEVDFIKEMPLNLTPLHINDDWFFEKSEYLLKEKMSAGDISFTFDLNYFVENYLTEEIDL